MMTVDDVIREAIDKLQELSEKTVNSIAEVIEQFFKEWLVEEYPTLEETWKEIENILEKFDEYSKERFFPSDQVARIVMRTQNKGGLCGRPCGNRPLMYWSGFV